MNETQRWMHMLDKAADSKRDFLEYLHYIDADIIEEAFYDEVVSWDEDRVMRFLKWWNWDLDTIELAVWEY